MAIKTPCWVAGGCLPKDAQQSLLNFRQIPQALVRAIIAPNATRLDFTTKQLATVKPSAFVG